MDSVSLLVSCGNSGGLCMLLSVKIVGKVIARPGCTTEEIGTGNLWLRCYNNHNVPIF